MWESDGKIPPSKKQSCCIQFFQVLFRIVELVGLIMCLAGLIVAATSVANAVILWTGFGLYCGGLFFNFIFNIIAEFYKEQK